MIPSLKIRKQYAVLFALIVSTALILSEINEIAMSRTLLSSIDSNDADNNNNMPQPQESNTQPLNILTLGGSVTWGATLSDRDDAYPFRLRRDYHHNVQNLAIRATGRFYVYLFVTIHNHNSHHIQS